MLPTWTVEDYKDGSGRSPVRKFVQGLTPAEQGRFRTRLKYLRLEGPRAGGHIFLNLTSDSRNDPKGKLWELRMPQSQHNPRVLAFLTSPRKIVLLHGIKKIGRPSNAIPKADIDIAIGRMNDYQERRQRS